MSRHAEQHGYVNDVQAADIRDEDSSQASEREATTVVLSLERFHDCLDSRRSDAMQHAASLYEVEQVPAIAVLHAGDQTVCGFALLRKTVCGFALFLSRKNYSHRLMTNTPRVGCLVRCMQACPGLTSLAWQVVSRVTYCAVSLRRTSLLYVEVSRVLL
jgi:hypothetical protein